MGQTCTDRFRQLSPMKTPVRPLSGRDTAPEAPHRWDKIGTQAAN